MLSRQIATQFHDVRLDVQSIPQPHETDRNQPSRRGLIRRTGLLQLSGFDAFAGPAQSDTHRADRAIGDAENTVARPYVGRVTESLSGLSGRGSGSGNPQVMTCRF